MGFEACAGHGEHVREEQLGVELGTRVRPTGWRGAQPLRALLEQPGDGRITVSIRHNRGNFTAPR